MTIIAVRVFVQPDNDKQAGMSLDELMGYLESAVIDIVGSEGWEVVKITVKEEAKRVGNRGIGAK